MQGEGEIADGNQAAESARDLIDVQIRASVLGCGSGWPALHAGTASGCVFRGGAFEGVALAAGPQFAPAEQALRSQEHHHDQQQRVEDHAVLRRSSPEQFGENGEHDRGEDRAADAAQPAERDHHDGFDRFDDVEVAGRDRAFVQGEKRPRRRRRMRRW